MIALKFNVVQIWTHLVQENLAFSESFPTIYNMPIYLIVQKPNSEDTTKYLAAG